MITWCLDCEPRGRDRAALCSAAAVAIGTLPACSFNGSSIHSQLDESEMRTRVRADFQLGMDARDVRDKLRSLGLDYSFQTAEAPPCPGCGDRGFVARVQPPGLHWEFYSRPAGELTLWLDGTSHLALARYRGHGTQRWEIIP